MSKKLNSRAIAAKISWQVIDKGQSLTSSLNDYFADSPLSPQDRGFVQELVYGVCRWYGALDHAAAELLNKPIRNKDRVVHFLLLTGLYQLRHTDTAEHAAVAETVAACQQLQRPWAKKLLNGCLRSFQRQTVDEKKPFIADAAYHMRAHPEWLSQAIKKAWPEHHTSICAANNQRPPMCLRVNTHFNRRDNYLSKLQVKGIEAQPDPYSQDGIVLQKPESVNDLPDFAEGAVSVQDTAAQLPCDILHVEPQLRVLDACAAPGGKAAHMQERAANTLDLYALDVSSERCAQLNNTLARLKLKAKVAAADATQPMSWPAEWLEDQASFDRILIDAPCSGFGVIRRHPDIKHHRRPSDITQLQQTQAALLNQLWELLKPGGLLLYMTCSILPEENQQQIHAFLTAHDDAELAEFNHPNALKLDIGKQTLPGVHNMDGFYYCLLRKSLLRKAHA